MCVFSVSVVRCDENEYRLIRDLLVGYDKRVRPSRNYTESLNVTFGLALAQIIDVVSEVVTCMTSLETFLGRDCGMLALTTGMLSEVVVNSYDVLC